VLPAADKPFKITIIARGQTGGHTRYLPEEDRHMWTKKQFKDMLAAAMGGRVAEEIVFNEVTTGAGDDLEQATNIARTMVTRYGMSEKLGPRTFGKREELVFLGREISEQRDYSDRVAQTIDEEVHDLIEGAHQSAITVIKEHMAKPTELWQYRIDHEAAEGDVLDSLWKGPPPEPDPIPAG
jgi:cell division protease FtsH